MRHSSMRSASGFIAQDFMYTQKRPVGGRQDKADCPWEADESLVLVLVCRVVSLMRLMDLDATES